MKEIYLSVDIETSGPLIATHSMLQIGACDVDAPSERFEAILKPISEAADPSAMEIVGKPLTYFETEGEDPATAIPRFSEWVALRARTGTPVFVAFNAGFDWGFVNWYFLSYTDVNPFGVAPLDIKAYYAGLSGSKWEDTRSSRLPERFSSPKRHTHDALDDAVEQADMFRRMRDSR